MVQSLIGYKSYSYLFKEYRDGLIGRRIQGAEWNVGRWTFEDQNQILVKANGKEIRISLSDEKTLNVNRDM